MHSTTIQPAASLFADTLPASRKATQPRAKAARPVGAQKRPGMFHFLGDAFAAWATAGRLPQ